VHSLLSSVGQEHPQALVYSLSVASKSVNSARVSAAETLLEDMRAHSGIYVKFILKIVALYFLASISMIPSPSTIILLNYSKGVSPRVKDRLRLTTSRLQNILRLTTSTSRKELTLNMCSSNS
jgi:phosphatidylinositol kinase/protein kinase (PI-3  family)